MSMTQRKINFINTTTADWHDDVASINEEFIDENEKEVLRLCRELIKKIEHFRNNLKTDI